MLVSLAIYAAFAVAGALLCVMVIRRISKITGRPVSEYRWQEEHFGEHQQLMCRWTWAGIILAGCLILVGAVLS